MASLSFCNFSEFSAYEDSEDFWAFFCARAFLTYSGSGFVPTSTGLLSAAEFGTSLAIASLSSIPIPSSTN